MGGTAGFSSIDALVGLLILASTLAFALNAQTAARRVAHAALEAREATGRLQAALDPPRPTEVTGVTLQASEIDAPRAAGAALCRVDASSRGRGGGKTWRMHTVQPCDRAGGA